MRMLLDNVPFILVFAGLAYAGIGSGVGWPLLLWAGYGVAELVLC